MESPWYTDDDGQTWCRKHPGTTLNPAHGILCAGCASEDSDHLAEVELGEGEQLVADASAAGLPDAHEAERRTWGAWAAAGKGAQHCRDLATMCETRARWWLHGAGEDLSDDDKYSNADRARLAERNEHEARKWLDVAVKYQANVRAFVAEQAKMTKPGLEATQVRERMAQRDRLARTLDSRTGAH